MLPPVSHGTIMFRHPRAIHPWTAVQLHLLLLAADLVDGRVLAGIVIAAVLPALALALVDDHEGPLQALPVALALPVGASGLAARAVLGVGTGFVLADRRVRGGSGGGSGSLEEMSAPANIDLMLSKNADEWKRSGCCGGRETHGSGFGQSHGREGQESHGGELHDVERCCFR